MACGGGDVHGRGYGVRVGNDAEEEESRIGGSMKQILQK